MADYGSKRPPLCGISAGTRVRDGEEGGWMELLNREGNTRHTFYKAFLLNVGRLLRRPDTRTQRQTHHAAHDTACKADNLQWACSTEPDLVLQAPLTSKGLIPAHNWHMNSMLQTGMITGQIMDTLVAIKFSVMPSAWFTFRWAERAGVWHSSMNPAYRHT